MNHTKQILSEEVRHLLLHEFNDTKADYPKDKNVVQLFEEQVLKTPDAIAVVFRDTHISYRELDERSNDLSCRLRATGALSEITAIYVHPSAEMVIGILGILKSGSAFLPLDPNHNPRRIEAVLEDSGCALLVTQPQLVNELSFAGEKISIDINEPVVDREKNFPPIERELLYVMYTSGSTGKPKGVKIAHSNLVNYNTWLVHKTGVCSSDKLLLSTSYAFDLGYTLFFSSLLTGAELHIIPRETYLSPASLINYIDRNKVTFLKFTPTLFSMVVNAPEFSSASFKTVRMLMQGGEAINPADLARIAITHPHIELMNHFGPTETTIGAVACLIRKNELQDFIKKPVIGKPISNTKCYILGANQELLPIGSKGELCISGAGVGLGYLGQDKLTSEKFIPNPFEKGERMYRTGDLARWLPNGTIEYLGRIDHQVKIRGYRVEPGEIEAHLYAHDAVSRCIVTLKEKEGRSFLVGYYTGRELDTSGLRTFLSERLPDYMIPSFFVHLREMPLTANGKIDRKELPEPEVNWNETYIAPSDVTEENLARVWAEILKLPADKISTEQSFFELGGDSLSANTLILKVREVFKVTISWPALFSNPTIQHLRQLIWASKEEADDTMQPAQIRSSIYPATLSQKNFFIAARFNPSEVFFDIMALYEIGGHIDVARLEASVISVIRRHESLRTSFTIEKGKVMQQVSDDFDFEITVIQTGSADIDAVIRSLKKPFDYSTFLFRTYYIEAAGKRYLFLDMPHIISDGHSVHIIMKEIVAHYNGSSIGPSPLQFSDFVLWQERFFASEAFSKKEEYWLEQFAVPPDALRFRQPHAKDVSANSIILKLPAHIHAALIESGTAAGGTTFNLLLSAYFALLSRLSGQEEIAVGVPTRFMNRFEFNHVTGLLTNTIALKCRLLPDMSLSSCVKEVHRAVIHGLENKEYPLDLLMEKLKSRKKTLTLFNTYLNYEKVEHIYGLDGGTLTRRPLKIWREKLPLSVDIYDGDDQISFRIKYQVNAITEETVHSFFENYCRVVQGILERGDSTIKEMDMEQCDLFEYGESVTNHNN